MAEQGDESSKAEASHDLEECTVGVAPSYQYNEPHQEGESARERVSLAAVPLVVQQLHTVLGVEGASTLPNPLLVTGSSGYLGRTLVRVARSLGLGVVGVDLSSSETTNVVGCVTDRNTLLEAATSTSPECVGVLHTAGLHAPNAPFFSEEEFFRINEGGTESVLEVAKQLSMSAGVVFSSTTSLMNSSESKELENSRCVVLNEDDPKTSPRNKYGRSKLAAERKAKTFSQLSSNPPVVVLRLSRFFAEEGYSKSGEGTGWSGKDAIDELLRGVRSSLEDICVAQFLALVSSQKFRGVTFVVSAPSPLLHASNIDEEHGEKEKDDRICFRDQPQVIQLSESARAAFERFGWTPPSIARRIYDPSRLCDALSWTPRVTFDHWVENPTESLI